MAAEKAGKAVAFIQGSAADLGPRFGALYLVTIGRAFHWMDRPKTLTALNGLVERAWVVVTYWPARTCPSNLPSSHFNIGENGCPIRETNS